MCDTVDCTASAAFKTLNINDIRAPSDAVYRLGVEDWANQCADCWYYFPVPTLVPAHRNSTVGTAPAEEIASRLATIDPILQCTRADVDRPWRLIITGGASLSLLCWAKRDYRAVSLKIICTFPTENTFDEIDSFIGTSIPVTKRICMVGKFIYYVRGCYGRFIVVNTTFYPSITAALNSARTPATSVGIALDGESAPRIWATPAGAYAHAHMVIPLWPEKLIETYTTDIINAVNSYGFSVAIPDAHAPVLDLLGLEIAAADAASGNLQLIKPISASGSRRRLGLSKKLIDANNRAQLRAADPNPAGWKRIDEPPGNKPIPKLVSDVVHDLADIGGNSAARDTVLNSAVIWQHPPVVTGITLSGSMRGPAPITQQVDTLAAIIESYHSATCTICMEPAPDRNVLTLVCGHKFHYYPDDTCSGILSWFDSGRTSCPNCRGEQPRRIPRNPRVERTPRAGRAPRPARAERAPRSPRPAAAAIDYGLPPPGWRPAVGEALMGLSADELQQQIVWQALESQESLNYRQWLTYQDEVQVQAANFRSRMPVVAMGPDSGLPFAIFDLPPIILAADNESNADETDADESDAGGSNNL